MGPDVGFGAALDGALQALGGSDAAPVEEETAPMWYETPCTWTGRLGNRLLYEYDPASRVLCIAAAEETIDSLLLGTRDRTTLQVMLYAMPGADGMRFDDVGLILPLPGAPIYRRDQLEILDEYGMSTIAPSENRN